MMRSLLRKTFALDRLRDGQDAVITRVMAGRPTIALMPTGAGKSLCYQLPALMLPGRTLVVSPLIALMKDQCDGLRQRGVPAVQLNSAVPPAELEEAEAAIADGSARIIFVTPERLAARDFISSLAAHPVSLLVVDEAHCVSHWGHDFRPAFLEIGRGARQLGSPTMLALTATATDEVVADIAQQLDMKDGEVVNTGVYRPNLHYRVEQMTREEHKLARTVEIVAGTAGSAIVYASTVAAAESVHAALVEAGQPATLYHGRLSAAARRANQDAFMAGSSRVIVATNAFGLGIDKPDTRLVLHYQMPSGLDAYYQESGRAGRDGKPADCMLLFQRSDSAVQRFFMTGRYPSFEDVSTIYRKLKSTPEDGGRWTPDALHAAIDAPKTKLQVALSLLRGQGVVTQDRAGRLRLVRDNIDDETLDRLMAAYRNRREHDKAMLEQMVFYGQTGWCRWRVLLEHFEDEPETTSCGSCDNCLRMAQLRLSTPKDAPPSVEPIELPAFELGDKVRVPRYGRGLVKSANAEQVEVEFAAGQVRAFLPAYVHAVKAPPHGRP